MYTFNLQQLLALALMFTAAGVVITTGAVFLALRNAAKPRRTYPTAPRRLFVPTRAPRSRWALGVGLLATLAVVLFLVSACTPRTAVANGARDLEAPPPGFTVLGTIHDPMDRRVRLYLFDTSGGRRCTLAQVDGASGVAVSLVCH